MLASLDDPPIAQRGMVYEPKYDGIRALVDLAPPPKRSADPRVRLYSRNGNDKTAQFPAIVAALASIGKTLDAPLLLDGEIVAVDAAGRPLGFQYIQGRIHRTTKSEIDRCGSPGAFSVLATTMQRSQRIPFEMNVFDPLIT